MSLILGNPAAEGQTVAPELAARNINFLRCVPAEMRLYSAPTMNQVAYKNYLPHLSAYMWSCQQQKQANLRTFGHPATIPHRECLPLRAPNLSVSLKDGDNNKHQAMLDLGCKVEKIRKSTIYLFNRPDGAKIKSVLALGVDKTAQAVDEFVNYAALEIFRDTLKVYTEFFNVQRYPAYIDANHFSSHYDGFSDWVSAVEKDAGEKRKRSNQDAGEEQVAKKVVIGDPAAGAVAHIPATRTLSLKHDGDSVVRIKNIPAKSAANHITSLTDLPGMYGIWSPYVSKTQFFDVDFVPRLVNQYFLQSLGSSKEGCLLAMEKFKREWGVLGKSEGGKELTHIGVCISLAIPAQARVLPYFQGGTYQGSFIMGYGFTISCQGTLYRPVAPTELRKQVEDTVTHKRVLARILELLSVQGDVNDGMSDLGRAIANNTYSGMMLLRKLCLVTAVSEGAKLQILELARGLDFKEISWSTNPSKLECALSLIGDLGEELPDDLPIHPSMLFTTERLSTVWSCFGFTAPSFRPLSGKLVAVNARTYSVTKREKGGEPTTEERQFSWLHVRFTTLQQSIADLKEVRDSGKIGIDVSPRREAANANRLIEKEDFISLKAQLVTFCGISAGRGRGVPEVETNPHAEEMMQQDDEDWD